MKPDDASLSSLVKQLRSLIVHDLAACSQISHRLPFTASYYKGMLVDSADERLGYTVDNALDGRETEVYELLQKLEAMGWDGLSGLEDFDSPFIRRKH